MKRYKLLKDLPTFNKGDTFRLTKRGNLMSEKAGVIAYAESTLEKFNILDNGWFEEVPEGERWRAYKGDLYWYVSSYSEASDATCSCMELYDSTDDYRYSIGNYFKTEAEAKKAAEWLKAFTILRDDTNGFRPDWRDDRQPKWSVVYAYDANRLSVYRYFYDQEGIIFFATGAEAMESIKKHEREWKTFYGVEE